MAKTENIKSVSKTNPGFAGHLDFTKMRRAAIEYLGKLSGKIWTDHNVHDPGITILESLIYALLDLGYRTNLPPGDLFTRNPEDKTSDNNFFTASRILANNPLTITDYRKLLVDIEGVKNAWLEVNDSLPVDFCRDKADQQPESEEPVFREAIIREEDFCKCTNLNGLYHVYIQLEDGINKNKHLYEKTIRQIRDTLLAHRNLCEDFLDIKILCKLELGICVEIDLEVNADAEEVYINMVEALKEFFSPSPRFYSLQQLLDKNRPIDEIFAGRPFNITESHGFVDTEEFENLKLRKELHLSDVYHLLSDIPGVRRIRNLTWIKCFENKQTSTEWKLILPENNIPSFSPPCSGFIFTRRGLPEKVDLKKFETYFEMKYSGVQKALYKEPSAFLDPVLPGGIYRNDLADYYSIQNEFPRVYGIKEGGLGANEPDERKAQALQLQGFLLFFDQLLANYLAQLKNMRSLFSLTSSGKSSDKHTYFINQLTNAPQLKKLLRFNIDGEGNDSLGTQGSILAYPTDGKKISSLIENGKLKNADPCENNFPDYLFCFAEDRNLALNQLRDDFLFGDCKPVIASNANDCYFFYFITTSSDVALVSKNYYADQKQAADAAASVKYSATFIENYRTFMTQDKSSEEFFSFDIELNLDIYSKYLQLIVEDEELYLKRRQDFLNHLLSRFAESFTDFALLSAPFLNTTDLPGLEIKTEERFLSHYDDISSNRGKAYDYLKNRWNSSNISGFEKRVKSLAGINNWNRHYLCNFIVEPADKLYRLSIILFDLAFSVQEKTFDEKTGLASLKSLYNKLQFPVFEYDFISHQQKYHIFIKDDFGNKYSLEKLFPDEEQTKSFVDTLDTAFRFQPDLSNDVFISRYIYKILFTDASGKPIAESSQHFTENADADNFGKKVAVRMASFLKDENEFIKAGRSRKTDKLIGVSVDTYPFVFINENEFVWKPVEVFHLKEKRIRFSVLNKKASFQFDSVNDFPNIRTAKENYRSILPLLAKASSYLIEKNKQTDKFEILISRGSEIVARFFDSFTTDVLASLKKQELLNEIDTYKFRLLVAGPLADEWEFKYRSGDETGNFIDYISRGNFKSSKLAIKAATDFYSNPKDLHHHLTHTELQLVLKKNNLNITTVALLDKPGTNDQKRAASIHTSRKRLYEDISDSSNKYLLSFLYKNRINPGEDFIYKLVDKDNLLAYHLVEGQKTDPDEAESQKQRLILEAWKGYNYIDIAKGADVIRERKEKKTKVWYHYIIKCNNRKYKKGTLAGKDLILFESNVGYASHDEALVAFQNEYLEILKYARNIKNYGKDKIISLAELKVHSSDPYNNNKSKVFVPRETSVELGDYDVEKILAPMAASYPVRFLRKKKYVFVLGMLDNLANTFSIDWKSRKEFSTASEAMERFQFFLVLLKYPGNYYVEWSSVYCDFRIHIREVLAVSAHGFASPEKAWGDEGVEKFICVSQSENGFHNYINKLTCNPGFFVACNNTGLRHPCSYDTPSRRDRIMDKLFLASDFNFMDLIQTVGDEEIILTDLHKNPLVKIHIRPHKNETELKYNVCEWLLFFMESVYNEKNYIKKGGQFSLNYRYANNGNKESYYNLAEPYDKNIGFRNWKLEIQKIACYFPIRRVDPCKTGSADNYTVEIKLPGFDPCCQDLQCDDPCRSKCKDPDCTPSCHVSWVSDCCFDDCCTALEFYLSSLILLKGIGNYKPVYDCNCGSYGIELHPHLTLKEKDEYFKRSKVSSRQDIICSRVNRDNLIIRKRNRSGKENLCLNEIVAINPQFYSNPEMACDAVTRSKKLINSEGLHLVEHILLRPRCREENGNYEECKCKGLPRPCIDKAHLCYFQWKPGGEPDPCVSTEPVCLTPGCDPYSFIATVALPAWPERFRSESGRKLMEKMLQREAPAHVLLRILWLRPVDFCCLEFYYKLWLEWLANKLCHPAYTTCDFLTLLFKKEFRQLSECKDCIPCDCGNGQSETCTPELQDPCDKITVLSKINELFCWSDDPELEFTNCDSGMHPGFIEKSIEKFSTEERRNDGIIKIVDSLKNLKEKESEKSRNKLVKDKFRLLQTRAHRYNLQINLIKEVYPDKEIVSNALTFLKKTEPTPEQYIALAEAIIMDRTNNAKKIKGLNKSQKQVVIENMTWKYLDSVYFNGKDFNSIQVLKNTFKLLGEKGVDMKELYRGWDSEKLEEFEIDFDSKKIKKWLLGQ